MPPLTVEQALQLARRHHQAGQLPQAEALYRQILQQNPNHPDALHLLGVIAYQAGRHDLAVDLIRRAIALKPNQPDAYGNLANALRATGQLDEAIAACRQAVALMPNHPQAQSNLGVALKANGQLEEAVAAYRQAIALQPNYAEVYSNLGNALQAQGQLDAALDAYRQAIALKPNYAEAHNNLSAALRAQGQLDAALAASRQAIALKPGFPEAHLNLGNALFESGLFDEASAAYRQALALKPHDPEACNRLGASLQVQGQLDAALAAYRQAIALHPSFPEAHSNLGNALHSQGQLDAALAAYRQAVALAPDNAAIHSKFLLTLHYHPACTAQAIADEHRRWNLRHAAPLKKFIQPHPNDRHPDRRLRIGYVSPDFRGHAVAPMVLPLLACHDHEQLEVFCYAHVEKPDAMTARFQAQADHWRSTVGLSDEQLAALIRQDHIDILVDLAGHTAGNRLLVFARKPAPVQVNRQGYPNTTGLTAIDYRLTDAHADPPGLSDTLHSEHLIRLPQTNWIYQPPEDCPPPVPLPPGAPITFGCFNNLAKVTEPMLRLWARLLAALPNSRLLLKAMSLTSPDVQQRIRGIFQEERIAPQRVDLVGWQRSEPEHLALYHQVAIALDPYPYHGTTTTCEALWMGVPVITLAGQTHVSRVGVSLLTNLGLPELIAQTPEEYVQIAVDLAHDLPRLSHLRSTLRQRMEQSPLMDAPRFARHIEAAYRHMWRQWCASPKGMGSE